MTTVDLTDTDHHSFVHDARTYIGHDALDLALERWVENDTTSAFSGVNAAGEDAVYAFAWVSGEGDAAVTMVQFDEEAGGYPVDALPFFLDIQHTEPKPPAPVVQQFFMASISSSKELFPVDLRHALATLDPNAELDIRKAF